MRPLAPLACVLLLAGAFAGCVGSDLGGSAARDLVPPVAADWAVLALAHGAGHDHRDPAAHAGRSTPNFAVLGHDPAITDWHGRTSGSYSCSDVGAREGRRYSFSHSFDSDVALVVADVTDPAAPFLVGELALPWTKVYDVAATSDGAWVFLAVNPPRRPDGFPALALDAKVAPAAKPTFRDACAGEARAAAALPAAEAVPWASGIVLVDVRDPAAPVIADYRPLPVFGAHSVFATLLDGRPLAIAAVTNLAHVGSYYSFHSVEEGPLGPRLTDELVYRPLPRNQDEAVARNGHVDAWAHVHPGTGDALAYLADWNGGLVIVDIDDLRRPVEVGRWNDYKPGERSGANHEAYPLDVLWDGRHYTIVGQELGRRPADTPSGVVSVLDTTDPSAPKRVGTWTLPADVEWEEFLQFSTHYVAVHERTMFVATYHGGLWAVDLADPTTPRTIGVFLPDRTSPAPPGELDPYWSPTVLDAQVFEDGTLVVWDGPTGVYTLRFDPVVAVPAVAEWDVGV